jgi:hypothetical protein
LTSRHFFAPPPNAFALALRARFAASACDERDIRAFTSPLRDTGIAHVLLRGRRIPVVRRGKSRRPVNFR